MNATQTPSYRLLAPIVGGEPQGLTIVDGPTYSGYFADASIADTPTLIAAGWMPIGGSFKPTTNPVGPAESGPTAAGLGGSPGTLFVDVTLGKVVVFDGSVWRDPL